MLRWNSLIRKLRCWSCGSSSISHVSVPIGAKSTQRHRCYRKTRPVSRHGEKLPVALGCPPREVSVPLTDAHRAYCRRSMALKSGSNIQV